MTLKPRTRLSVPAEITLEELRKKPCSAADQERAVQPAPSSRRRIKPTSKWFCVNECCQYHDHLSPIATKDAKQSATGEILCPACDTATLVPATPNDLPPWYDHEAIRKRMNTPVELTFPTRDTPVRTERPAQIAQREGDKT